VTRPEEALGRAREAVERKRAEGAYPASESAVGEPPSERPSPERLKEWALLDVEPSTLYSTRRLGAPITLLKRGLLRLLRQYTSELEARQTRFNLAVLGRLRELEERVERLERDR